jgi:hypothetical protein
MLIYIRIPARCNPGAPQKPDGGHNFPLERRVEKAFPDSANFFYP